VGATLGRIAASPHEKPCNKKLLMGVFGD